MWQCVVCGEQIEEDFDVCWNCQTSKDGKPSESFASAPLPKELEGLRERMANASDEDLSKMVNVNFKQYREEALLLARGELARRNLPMRPIAKLCSNCNAELEDDAKFCAECRTPIAKSGALECPSCQKTLSPDSKFCKYCAAEIVPQAKVPPVFARNSSLSTPSPQTTKANNLARSGAILAIVSAVAFWWGQSYTSSWANTARAGMGNLVGQQDSVYQLADYCIILGALGFIVGVVLFIVGLSQR
jgi:Double zinc ribbon